MAISLSNLLPQKYVPKSSINDNDEDNEKDDTNNEDDGADLFLGRVRAVVASLTDQGRLLEVSGGVGAGEDAVRYLRVPPVPAPIADVRRDRRRERADVAQAIDEFGMMKSDKDEKQLQTVLEREFADFFGEIVSEWNPCYDADGHWRYKWDDEIGAHDIGVSLEPETSDTRAKEIVSAREPERMYLRALLDSLFERSDDLVDVDVQPLWRLVAALVHRVARHTLHGHQAPKLGVHPCARGTEKCPVCRYGFPRTRLPRNRERRMVMEKGEREGQWHAHFPRNDSL